MTLTETPEQLLASWLRRQLDDDKVLWLQDRLAMLAADDSERNLHIALGMSPRYLGRDDLKLDTADLVAARRARADWDPGGWSVDQAARILMLCRSGRDGEAFSALYSDLCRSADVAEAVALYRGLPLYPAPDLLEPQAAEGVRTNMRAVFEAVAHRNPFPREQFDENRWNQMVLKALFVDSRLHPIQGLDARANPALAEILSDYAHERWAAGRRVSPELWRCLGPFAEGAAIDDLERALGSGDRLERRAAALALAASPAARAKELLAAVPDISGKIASGSLTWQALSVEL